MVTLNCKLFKSFLTEGNEENEGEIKMNITIKTGPE